MHSKAIKLEQKKVFEKLGNFPEFYLVGGTALALQIGHRISVDFDLFSEKALSLYLLKKVKRVFKSIVKIRVNRSDQLSLEIYGVKIDFVEYPFPLVLKSIKYQGVKLLRIPEIAAMKAQALGRRTSFKDYVDLYFILKEKHASLSKIIDVGYKKYKDEFNARLFLEQLIYVEEAEEVEMEFLKKSVTKSQMKKFFENEIRKIKL